MGVWACLAPWSHCGMLANVIPMIVLGHIGCIAPIKLASKFWPIPCPMDTFEGNQRRANHIWNLKKKKKPNVRLNIMDEGYPLHNEGIAYVYRRL